MKVVKDIIESNPGIKDLNSNNIMKNAAGDNLNENSNNNNKNIFNFDSSIEDNCNKILEKIKGFKEIQNNPELFKLFSALKNQVKKIKLNFSNYLVH